VMAADRALPKRPEPSSNKPRISRCPARRRIYREIPATFPDTASEFCNRTKCRRTGAGGDRRTSRVPDRGKSARRDVARRGASAGRAQAGRGSGDPGESPRRALPSVLREPGARPAVRGSHAGEIPRVLFRCDRHHGPGRWSHHRHLQRHRRHAAASFALPQPQRTGAH
jgi:hypothetical protein